jgi:alcohol dehydrogenase (cytochrome c)
MKDSSILKVAPLVSTMLASTSLLAMAADVTTPRLLNADKEPQNWLQVNKDYAAHRYSPLDQINKNNAEDLHVAFTVAFGYPPGTTKIPFAGHQSTPLVDDGAMYVVDGWGVYRIDVRDPAKARIACLDHVIRAPTRTIC